MRGTWNEDDSLLDGMINMVGTLQGARWNEGDILTVGWCALRGGLEDDSFPPLLQERCLHN